MRTRLIVRWLFAVLALSIAQHAGANVIVFAGVLSGGAESPPTASSATGSVEVDIDTLLNTMRVRATFSGLTSGTTASHIHCCTALPGVGNAGVATTTPSFPGFPLGVTSGTFDNTFDLTVASSYNPAFVTAEGSVALAEAALIAGMLAGDTYYNIHTTNFPNGEIRAFLAQVPEPWTTALLGIGVALGLAARRRTRLHSA
jgi:hypothetical protein